MKRWCRLMGMKQAYKISSSTILLICVLPFTSYSKKKADLQFNEVKLAAAEGDAETQYELAELYAEGDGVEQNLVEAVKWYRKAAEQGHDSAQFEVGLSYQNGKGVPQSVTEAYIWLNISAENGARLNGRGRAGELADEIRKNLPANQLKRTENIAKRRQKEISRRVEENYIRIINELNADGWKINMKIELMAPTLPEHLGMLNQFQILLKQVHPIGELPSFHYGGNVRTGRLKSLKIMRSPALHKSSS